MSAKGPFPAVLLTLLLGLAGAAPASGQQAQTQPQPLPPAQQAQPAQPQAPAAQLRIAQPVLVIDIEKVFAATVAGKALTQGLQAKLKALVAENRRIEAELVAEEKALTEKRKTMSPKAFRKLADAFDAKVQKIRAQQDAKQKALQDERTAERQNFVDNIAPLLSTIARERGALVILERRSVLLSADAIDITEEAIARINEALDRAEKLHLGQGQPVSPQPQQATPAPTPAPAQDLPSISPSSP